jgi:3'-phosphoadenosine 5'-phosphosulfate sulfotransferase (PAPS reductase)/FAD synthetase
MSDPYRIEGPALISFSGGRTSGFMLHEIVKAYDGVLPPNLIVAFANTGKEREETLRFVHECQTRWGVKIHWVEWREGKPGFEEVGFNSASRSGEPFERLIQSKQRLPNSFERWCTQYLKVKPMFALMKETLGLDGGEYLECIGLRDDEGMRILKGFEKADKHGRRVCYPLAKAKVHKPDVMKFWLGDNSDPKKLTSPLPQGFDLGLYPWEGNCTLCFMKGKGIRKRIIRDNPLEAKWWSQMEIDQDGWFDSRTRVRELVEEVRRTPSFFDDNDGMEYDVECGLHCAPYEGEDE